MRHTVVPLLKVPEHTDAVRVMQLDMPGVPVEDLQVNLTRLERVMHWGGIKFLALGSYEGEGSEHVATNVTINPDGTLSATKSKTLTKARVAQPQSQDLHNDSDYRWRNVAVYFDSTSLKERQHDSHDMVGIVDRSLRTNLFADIAEHELAPKKLAGELALIGLGVAISKIGIDARLIRESMSEDLDWQQVPLLALAPKLPIPLLQKMLDMTNPVKKELPPKYSTYLFWRADRAALAARHLSRRIITLQQSQ